MYRKRIIVIAAVVGAFAGCAALALAQTETPADGGDAAPAGINMERAERTAAADRAAAPPETVPGPEIAPNEVHIPVGAPSDFFVKTCEKYLQEDALEAHPWCQVIFLMKWGKIDPGVYLISDVESLYEAKEAQR